MSPHLKGRGHIGFGTDPVSIVAGIGIEALLMSTHNIHFYGELEKIIQEISPNICTPSNTSHLIIII